LCFIFSSKKDINAERLKFAQELGANKIVLIKAGLSVEQFVDKVKEEIGQRPDISIECSGIESSIKLAILSTKSGGKVVLVGLGSSEVTIPLMDATKREVDIRGIFRYKNW
jgi:L-iditol 2-dehydrogenase